MSQTPFREGDAVELKVNSDPFFGTPRAERGKVIGTFTQTFHTVELENGIHVTRQPHELHFAPGKSPVHE